MLSSASPPPVTVKVAPWIAAPRTLTDDAWICRPKIVMGKKPVFVALRVTALPRTAASGPTVRRGSSLVSIGNSGATPEKSCSRARSVTAPGVKAVAGSTSASSRAPACTSRV